MKKLLTLGLSLFIAFVISANGFAAISGSEEINRIMSIQPVLDQEQVIGELKEMVPSSNDGVYQYYDDPAGIVKKMRSFSLGDRTEIEIINNEGKWELAQIQNNKKGIIAHYKDGKFIEYTRRLGNGIVGHYFDHYNKIMEDPKGQNADFYTRFTKDGIYACFCNTLENALNESAHLRIFSFEDRYRIETKNSSGKWNLAMIIQANKGTIANYKDREFVDMSQLEPNGNATSHDRKLASL